MMYYAVMLSGVCIAKIVWDGVGPYNFPYPHDDLTPDPGNIIPVASDAEPQDSEEQ